MSNQNNKRGKNAKLPSKKKKMQMNNNKSKTSSRQKRSLMKFSRNYAPTTIGTTSNFQNRPIRVKKREFICDLTGTETNTKIRRVRKSSDGLITSILSLCQNAGLVPTFPWLSTLATGFEKFLFHSLKFDYVPTCPTSTPGAITLSNNSNPARPETSWDETAYSTKSNSVQSSLWKPCSLKVPLTKLQETTKSKLVRTGPLSENDDVNLTDTGILDVVINAPGTNSGSQFGKLYVDYDVSLINPKLSVKESSFIWYCADFTMTTQTMVEDIYDIEQPNVVRTDGSIKMRAGQMNGTSCGFEFYFTYPNKYYLVDMTIDFLSGTTSALPAVIPMGEVELDSTLNPWSHKDDMYFSFSQLCLTSNECSSMKPGILGIGFTATTITSPHIHATINVTSIEVSDIVNFQHKSTDSHYLKTLKKVEVKDKTPTSNMFEKNVNVNCFNPVTTYTSREEHLEPREEPKFITRVKSVN